MKFLVTSIALIALSMPQSLGIRLNTPGAAPPPSNVLSASDLSFDGFIRIPSSGVDTSYPAGSTGSVRMVGGQPHVFIWGRWDGNASNRTDLYELDVSGLTPNTTINSAPRATLYANWGDPSHGLEQSWDGSCNPLVGSTPPFPLPQGGYYNDGTSLFYFAYQNYYTTPFEYNVMASSLDSISGTTGTTTVRGGPWRTRITTQYNSIVRDGIRSSYFVNDPRDNTMMVGGHGYETPTKDFGPTLYGGRAWPTASDPSGCGSARIISPNHYSEYYPPTDSYPSRTPGYFNQFTGALTGSFPTLKWSPSIATYAWNRAAANGGSSYGDPLSTGYAGVTDDTADMSIAGFFSGVHKTGVLFYFWADASAGGGDPTNCATVSESQYLNDGSGVWIHFSSHTGTPVDGTLLTGGTSNAKVVAHYVAWLPSPENVLGGTTEDGSGHSVTTPDFITGETITGTGFTGVMDYWHRGDTFDDYTDTTGKVVGCSFPGSVTGPAGMRQTPLLLIYDPATMDAVKNNTANDYAQNPAAVIDLTASPFGLAFTRRIYQVVPGPGGGGIDPVNNKLYLIFHFQDDLTHAGSSDDVIGRFSINDSAPPDPHPSPMPLWPIPVALIPLAWRRPARMIAP